MPITQPNPHCGCSQAGYCSRHQMEKSHYHYQCCLGVSGAADCGLKMWIAWELGRLGATEPADPVLEPEWPCSNVNLLNPHDPRPNKPIPQTRPPMKELLEKKLAQSPVGLPGTRVKYLVLTEWKQRARRNCKCDERARQMDDLGCDGCREKIDTCVEWLMEGAAERYWLRPIVALISEDRIWMKPLRKLTDKDITPEDVARSIVTRSIEIEEERVNLLD